MFDFEVKILPEDLKDQVQAYRLLMFGFCLSCSVSARQWLIQRSWINFVPENPKDNEKRLGASWSAEATPKHKHARVITNLCLIMFIYYLFIQWLNFKLFSWLGSRARARLQCLFLNLSKARARARTQPRKKFKLFPIRTLADLDYI